MNTAGVKRYCRSLPDVVETRYGAPDNWLVYSIRGRKFAYFKTSEPERWRLSVRVTPDRFVELTEVPGVRPARWRGRYGWVTIVEVSRFPAQYLQELVRASYARAARGRA
jgi:predicted DNA-binding protein (MmcQ/YjbR family)